MTNIYELQQFQPPSQCATCKKLYPVIERDIYAHGRHGYDIHCGCVILEDKGNRPLWADLWSKPCQLREEK